MSASATPAKGLEGVVAAQTELCDLDGANGRLAYRGYDIDEGRLTIDTTRGLSLGQGVELIVSDYGRRLLRDELARESVDGGEPLAPIVHAGCVWTVTLDPTPVLRHCGTASPLPTTSRDLQLALVNGWVWVNDVNQGGIWFVREDDVEVLDHDRITQLGFHSGTIAAP